MGCCFGVNEINDNTTNHDHEENKICDHIESLFNSCITNQSTHTETEKLLKLIAMNEKTETFAFNYLKKIQPQTGNKLKVDGDEHKSDDETNPNLKSARTLEKRLSNFEDKIYTPSNINELIDKVQHAVNSSQKIKAMGSRYAFSNITFSDDLLIDMYTGLNDPNMNINHESLNKYGQEIYNQNNLHLCQSGASIEAIQESLWPKTERHSLINKQTNFKYKALRDVPGYHKLCFGGCINVGATGEGTPFVQNNDKNSGSMTNQILAYSMIIIDENSNVRLVQIEPSIDNGAIHDAVSWKKQFPDISLIQNDDTFEAGLISIGLLGIVYSYYILLTDAYFVEEKRYMLSYNEFKNTEWDNLRQQILNNEIVALEYLLTPYKRLHGEFEGDHILTISTYCETNKIPLTTNKSVFSGENAPAFIIQSAAVTINWLTRILPDIIPFVTEMYLRTIIHDGVVKPCTDLGSVGGSANSTPSKTSGFAFSYNKNKLFNFMDDWIKLMNDIRRNDKNQITPFPLAVRFSSYKSKGLLNMFNSQHNGYFWCENIIPHFDATNSNITATVENVDEILYQVQLLSMKKPYFGNPHWGLHLVLKQNENIFKNIDKDKFNKFINIYKRYNKTETFSNEFTKQSILDDIHR
eukprot:292515_1